MEGLVCYCVIGVKDSEKVIATYRESSTQCKEIIRMFLHVILCTNIYLLIKCTLSLIHVGYARVSEAWGLWVLYPPHPTYIHRGSSFGVATSATLDLPVAAVCVNTAVSHVDNICQQRRV